MIKNVVKKLQYSLIIQYKKKEETGSTFVPWKLLSCFEDICTKTDLLPPHSRVINYAN
jgi:hypothetical protein